MTGTYFAIEGFIRTCYNAQASFGQRGADEERGRLHGLPELNSLGMATVQVVTHLTHRVAELGTAWRDTVHSYAQGHELELQAVVLDRLEKAGRVIDVLAV